MIKNIIKKTSAIVAFIWIIIPFITVKAQEGFYYKEPGTGATGLFKLNEVAGSEAYYTAAPGRIDYSNSDGGWIRMTENKPGKFGCIVFDKSFPSTMGFTFEFDFKVYNNSLGASPAEGFCLFLINEDRLSQMPDQKLQHGGARYDGSLGYASTSKDGLNKEVVYGASPTYLGIGLNVMGEFSKEFGLPVGAWGDSVYYRVGEYPPFYSYGGNLSKKLHSSIAIRGGDNKKYRYIAGTGSELDGKINSGNVPGFIPITDELLYTTTSVPDVRPDLYRGTSTRYYRRAKIEVNPSTKTNGVLDIAVYLKVRESGNYIKILEHTYVNNEEYSEPLPKRLRLGFSAATGDNSGVFEIRNIFARTPGDFQVLKNFTDYDSTLFTLGNDFKINTYINNNTESSNQYVTLNDTLPYGFNATKFEFFDGATDMAYTTTPTPDNVTTTAEGKKVYTFSNLNINSFSSLKIVYTGTISKNEMNKSYYNTNGDFYTAARITPLPGTSLPSNSVLYAKYGGRINLFNLKLDPNNKKYGESTEDEVIVIASNTAPKSYTWQYLKNDGTWGDLNTLPAGTSTTSTFKLKDYPSIAGLLTSQNLVVRCVASWSSSVQESVSFAYYVKKITDVIQSPNLGCKITGTDKNNFGWDFMLSDTSGTSQILHTGISPLIGNISGDGTPKILVAGYNDYSYSGQDKTADYVVFNTNMNYQAAHREGINKTDNSVFSTKGGNPFAIARYNNDTYIVYAGTDNKLKFINYTSSGYGFSVNKNSVDYYHNSASIASVGFADFNADGKPEVYAGQSVFDINSNLIARTAGNSGVFNLNGEKVSRPVAADVDNDGFPEYVAGDEVYSVDVNGKKMTLKYKLPDFSKTVNGATVKNQDGQTQVVDWDGDGLLDIVVSYTGNNRFYVYVWNVHKGLIAYYASTEIATNNSIGMPAFGDINGDGKPEMVFMTKTRINILKPKPITTPYDMDYQYFDIPSATSSGYNGLSLFDFNQDGIAEMVYRDTETLRIVNLNVTGTTTLQTLASVALYSSAGGEYPVIADIDGDGSAEIITVGSPTPNNGSKGNLRIYKPVNQKTGWAPARSVWNQHAYNPVYVNEDLTIPRVPLLSSIKMNNGVDRQTFNNYLQQTTTVDSEGNQLWFKPDILFAADPVSTYSNNKLTVDMKITNNGYSPVRPPLKISVYRKSGGNITFLKTDTVKSMIKKSTTVNKKIEVDGLTFSDATDVIIVRLNNDNGMYSTTNAKSPMNGYIEVECDYSNNDREFKVDPNWVVTLKAQNDFQTVQKYYSTIIDVLSNDVLPSDFFKGSFSLVDSVSKKPIAGELYTIDSGENSKLVYVSNGNPLTNNIDSFQYKLKSGATEVSAWVYIYVIEDLNGAVACPSSPYKTKISNKPNGVNFEWNTGTGNTGGLVWNIQLPATGDIKVKPTKIPLNSYGGGKEAFPEIKYEIKIMQAGAIMRWTGQVNTDWNNPNNWVETYNRFESPVLWPPSKCVDVIIPSDVDNFPELVDSAYCRKITIKDRAMLKNPHILNHDSASVEIKLKPSELDRFIMWSAPVKNLVSGDYVYKVNGREMRGDVFMNFFQTKNPDFPSSQAVMSRFTSTIGSLNEPLPLGRPFNLKVVSTSITRDSLLRFSKSSKLITDDMVKIGTDLYEYPVIDNFNNIGAIQIVNPYLAYLSIEKLLAGNNSLYTGFYIWNGELDNNLTAIMIDPQSDGYRLIVTDDKFNWDVPDAQNPTYIAPLQSFFIVKVGHLDKFKISPEWTTTSIEHNYRLRGEKKIDNSGMLKVKLSQGEKTAGSVLVYKQGSTGFVDKMDMPAIVYDEIPLVVYTLAVSGEPLYINSSAMFDMSTTPIGIRARDAGETKLEFSGLETFGYDVILIDKELNKNIDLKVTPEYTFILKKPNNNSEVIELNDRFELKMYYTGKFTETENIHDSSQIKVSSSDGYVKITSGEKTMSSINVYDLFGKLVYEINNIDVNEHNIKLNLNQIYILKIFVDNYLNVSKIMVK